MSLLQLVDMVLEELDNQSQKREIEMDWFRLNVIYNDSDRIIVEWTHRNRFLCKR